MKVRNDLKQQKRLNNQYIKEMDELRVLYINLYLFRIN